MTARQTDSERAPSRESGGAVWEKRTVGGLDVRFLRPATLDGTFDAAALLRGDDVDEPPYWMHLWPGAATLAAVVAAAPEVGPGKRVVELGCGLGLPSLAAARRGATVFASDWKHEPLAWIRESARAAGSPVHSIRMSWEQPALRGGFAVCIGADIAYDVASEPSLAAALARLVDRDGVVWLADSVNTHRDSLPARLEDEGFAVRSSRRREEEEGRAVWVRLIEARRRA